MAGVNYSFALSSIQPIDELITFSESSLRHLSMPHYDALVLTLEVRKHLMKRILVYLGSATDLLYFPPVLRLGYNLDNLYNLGRVLVDCNGSQTNLLGEILLPISIGPFTALVPLKVIDEPSPLNAILGCT